MNRTEAMKLIGKPVYAITALNGEYIGICKEIITPKGSPWRANVAIKAVTDYPVIGFGEGGYKRRRPFEEGRIINVGNCSVELLKDDETIPNYEDSVKTALDASITRLEEHVEHDKQLGKRDGLIIKWLEVLNERKSETKEKSYFLRVVESISPDEKQLLRKYKSTRRVVKGDIPSLNKLKKRRTGIIWHEGFLDEDIKPKQLVGLTIFGGWVCDALAEKEKDDNTKI